MNNSFLSLSLSEHQIRNKSHDIKIWFVVSIHFIICMIFKLSNANLVIFFLERLEKSCRERKANKPVIPYADRNLAIFRFIQCPEHPSKSSWKISNNVPDSSVGCRDRYNKPGRIERGETAERLIRGGGGARVKTYRLYSPRFVSRQLTDL